MQEQNLCLTILIALEGGDASSVQQETTRLATELRQYDLESLQPVTAGEPPVGAKGFDPALLGALAATAAPIVLPKILDFLHAWTLRREGRVVKVKIQRSDGSAIEGEFPETMSPEQARRWIKTVASGLSKPVS